MCERKFKKLDDFPQVYLENFERNKLPPDLVLPYNNMNEIFVSQGTNLGNPIAPQEVVESLKNNQDIEYDGWIWRIDEQISKNSYSYLRRKKNNIDSVLKEIDPYLTKLKNMVGRQVKSIELLPEIKKHWHDDTSFEIPNTTHNLHFIYENPEENSNDEEKLRKATIYISGTNLPPVINDCPIIGTLFYYGRLNEM